MNAQSWLETAQLAGGVVEEAGAGSSVVSLRVDECHIEAGSSTGPGAMTWLTSEAPGSTGLRLAVSPQDDFPFRDAFAIESGDAGFDGRFSIKTNDGPFARLWLDEHVRQSIASASAEYHFLLENGRSRVWRFAQEDDPGDLAEVVRALAALSQRGRTLMGEWARLADSIGGRLVKQPSEWRPDGAISIHIRLAQATVVVDGFFGALGRRRPGRGLFTRVRCPRRSSRRDQYVAHDAAGRRALKPRLPVAVQRVELLHGGLAGRYRVECEDPELGLPRFDSEVCERIADAGPEIIIADPEQVTVFFLGYESDPKRVRIGIEIAESLAVEQTPAGLAGPYR